AAIQTYSAMHGPRHAPGILGRNCAVRRVLLDETEALDAAAPTGTDYVLAKMLSAAGIRIRQVPESRMLTNFPSRAHEYLRQQRRWLRNVVLHGRRFGARDETRAALRTSLVGMALLLLLPLGLLLLPWLIVVWSVLVAQALFARLRYLVFAGAVLNGSVRPAYVMWQAPLLLLDLLAWTQPMADYVWQRNRWVW
ncbi:MAG: glycosyltransferase, partial [Anaerolineaceae bacterium]